ncbi:UreE urease accessory domain-containing protein [Cyanobacterium stanieri PCC 7202]|uniref:Urease accessory protein UreE n=1 Tax=Cyanobacterium stanieri (strain ATCC 29140 / PCC 7202) TaxID=292563 RepID=K9YJ02_CYASC|nr:UreE urease accessory domain-containing protein [Cyanobacterium stanieri PCC 7202]
MIVLDRYVDKNIPQDIDFDILLTAEERQKTRQKFIIDGQEIKLNLKRGTILVDGDLLTDENGTVVVKVRAKSEPVMTIISHHSLDLIRASYHLGNRHVSLEIGDNYLRFSSDHVLASMVINLGLQVIEEIAPFCPEIGAYHHSHH